jgi:hypothetical protein
MKIPKGQTRHRQEKYEHTEGRIRSRKSKKDNIGHKTQKTQRRKLKQWATLTLSKTACAINTDWIVNVLTLYQRVNIVPSQYNYMK